MTEFAKDVAKQLDRRQRRRKLIVYGVWLIVVVLAVIYLRCGRGWGLGGKGGDGGGVSAGSGSTQRRCGLRVTAHGIVLDGKPTTRDAAIAACRTGADVVVTGDARQGDWDDLREALHAANIDVVVHDGHP